MADGNANEKGKFSADQLKQIYAQLQSLTVENQAAKQNGEYKFWNTQPVPKIDEEVQDGNGPIEPDLSPEQIRKEPLNLPSGFEWCELDLLNDIELEELNTLIKENYVEDPQAMFRFDYGKPMLRWALMPPGWKKEWHVGVRSTSSNKLLAFIGGTPVTMRVYDKIVKMVDIDFLCSHKKLRSKRLAPVLIKEITRRVHLYGNRFQAVYTAGITLPKPVSYAMYYHRSLNVRKLIETGFSHLRKNMTMARTVKLYKLPEVAKTPGFRPLEEKDLPQVHKLYEEYMKKFDMVKMMDSEEAKHFFLPKDSTLYTYVVENPKTHRITHFGGYYCIMNSVSNNPKHSFIKTAFLWFYAAPDDESLKDFMNDILIMAHKEGFDCMNALRSMNNSVFLEDLKFAEGDGRLNFYLFNWKCPKISAEKQGFLVI